MTELGASGSLPPQTRESYKQECARGLDLFQKSFDQFQKSQMPAQKDQYKEVMEKALQVIRETATQCLPQELQKQEVELEKDYRTYLNNPTPDNLTKVNQDVQALQKGF